MFVWSVRASSLKFLAGAFLCVFIIAAMIVIIPSKDKADSSVLASSMNYEGITDESKVVEFIESFGWKVEAEPEEVALVTIPDEFDKVFVNYNEIQKRQGLDLSSYKRKTVKRYTYSVTNYKDYEGKVLINVIVYRNRVIGGDICSAAPDGFVFGFEGK